MEKTDRRYFFQVSPLSFLSFLSFGTHKKKTHGNSGIEVKHLQDSTLLVTIFFQITVEVAKLPQSFPFGSPLRSIGN